MALGLLKCLRRMLGASATKCEMERCSEREVCVPGVCRSQRQESSLPELDWWAAGALPRPPYTHGVNA